MKDASLLERLYNCATNVHVAFLHHKITIHKVSCTYVWLNIYEWPFLAVTCIFHCPSDNTLKTCLRFLNTPNTTTMSSSENWKCSVCMVHYSNLLFFASEVDASDFSMRGRSYTVLRQPTRCNFPHTSPYCMIKPGLFWYVILIILKMYRILNNM